MMSQVFYRSCLAVSLASISFLGAQSAQAGTAELAVSATIPSSCTFDQASYSNTTNQSTQQDYIGWAGSVNIACNHGGQVLISTSEPVPSADLATFRGSTKYKGEFFDLSGDLRFWGRAYHQNGVARSLNPGTINYTIGINSTDVSTPIPPGTYGLTFTLTATPN